MAPRDRDRPALSGAPHPVLLRSAVAAYPTDALELPRLRHEETARLRAGLPARSLAGTEPPPVRSVPSLPLPGRRLGDDETGDPWLSGLARSIDLALGRPPV